MLFAWITDPNAACARYADAAGDRSWDRQYYFPFSGGGKASHSTTCSCAPSGVGGSHGYASGAAGINRLGYAPDKSAFTIFSQEISARDLILLLGGLFLIWKASKEIHESIEGEEEGLKTRVSSFLGAIVQIMLLDIIFSLDSVITAVGLSDHLFIMMAAVVIAVGVMMFAARSIGDFVERHPSVKMLALSFLILVGFTLILESFDIHVPKGYIYFAMFFSIAVESLNLIRNKKNPL